MSRFTKEVVDKFADEQMFAMTEEEKIIAITDLEAMEQHMEMIDRIPGVEAAEPMTHCLDDFMLELREDEAVESTPIEDLLANADEVFDREIELPKVVNG